MAINIPIISSLDTKGFDKAKREFSQLEGVGAKSAFAIKKAAVPAAAAIGGLAVVLGDATKAAMEDAASQEELARTLRTSTGATDKAIAATEEWISQQGKLLGFTDDELRPALAGLTRATGSIEEAQKAAGLAMDISAAKGVSLETVTKTLEKAYGGNLTALGKLDPAVRDMVKGGASLDEVMAKLSGTFSGSAKTAAETTAGQFKRLGIAMNETKESIGTALLPVIEAALPILQKFGAWAQDNPGAFVAIAGAIGGVALAITAVNIAMALNPFSAIAAGIALLVAGVVVAYNKFEGFRNVVRNVVNGIASYFEFMVNAWITAINVVIRGINLVKPGKDIVSLSKVSFGPVIGPEGRGPSGADKSRLDTVPAMAAGGIVNRATFALIGEKGPEAVIPLDRLGAMGNTNVTINVNGGDPNTVVDALRRYMRANGSVPITVSNA
jgi:SLT domain-containing protein